MWFTGKINSKGDSSFERILGLIILGVILFIIIIVMAIFISFSGDISEWENREIKNVAVDIVGPNSSQINLGSVSPPSGDFDYTGEAYEGFRDPLQQAMAQEILEIYSEAIEKQGELLAMGYSKDLLMEYLLGIHTTETDTYSGKPGVTGKTYIPSVLVKWEEYGTGKTVDGKVMNFRNYGWQDFKKKHAVDNPGNRNPGTSSSSTYYAGFNYKMRSNTGAIGSFQMQPLSWAATQYQEGTYKASSPNWVNNIEQYVKTSLGSGRAKDFEGDGVGDIFGLPDQAFTNIQWMHSTFTHNSSSIKKNNLPYDQPNSNGNDQIMFAHSAGAFFRGDNGFYGKTKGNVELYNKDTLSIFNDDTAWRPIYEIYKDSRGHGVKERDLILKAYTDRGWKRSGDNFSKTENGKTVSMDMHSLVYPVRARFQGKAWYMFLRGVAYGNQASPGEQVTAGLGTVRYNYMTTESAKMTTSDSVRRSALDTQMALGYKGPFPIFDQNGPPMKEYWFLNTTSGAQTFGKSACTLFTMASMANASGKNPAIPDYMDSDNNGVVDAVEWWIGGKKALGKSTYNPRVRPTQTISTESLRGILSKTGFKVKEVNQGWGAGSDTILADIKAGIPHHVRVMNNRKITGIAPKLPKKDIDYNTFNMHNLDNYDLTPKKVMNVAYSIHSVVGVEVKEINGKDYISIVNSTGHHGGAAYDSNLVWFDARELLNDGYHGGYAIVGSDDPNWKPNYAGGAITTPSDQIYDYTGVQPTDLIEKLEGIMTVGGTQQEVRIRATDDRPFISLPGRYETKKVGDDRILIVAGQSNNDTMVLEISGVTNIQTNSAGNINGGENTNLFKLPQGVTATVRTGSVRSDGTVIYDSFYDEASTD